MLAKSAGQLPVTHLDALSSNSQANPPSDPDGAFAHDQCVVHS